LHELLNSTRGRSGALGVMMAMMALGGGACEGVRDRWRR
jgi:hypothetical protein